MHPDVEYANRWNIPVDIHIVSCGMSKLDRRARARDLYTGSTFRRSLDYCESRASFTEGTAPCLIVSALYGLIDPDKEIDPYDLKVTDHTDEQRRIWCELVRAQLREMGVRKANIHLHAGARYYLALKEALDADERRLRIVEFFNPWQEKGAPGIGERRGAYRRITEREARWREDETFAKAAALDWAQA